MNARLKKTAVVLTLAVIVLGFIVVDKKIALSATSGGDIDLFTQKDPYSGKGKDLRSDAFGPEEITILYALATYNNMPLQNFLVAFQVTLPSNASFTLTTRTNSSGVAKVNFTIMTPPISINESDIFGEWHVVATVQVESVTYQDTMAFKVDWIVKLLSVRTIDENLTYRTYFGKGGDVGFEVTLRNIAMILKRATLALVIYDELSVPINYTEAHNFDVQPNEKLVFVYFKLQVPLYAYTGNATVFVSALTCPANQTGVAYCPPISASFFIRSLGPIQVAFHDVAVVDVAPSAASVKLGQPLNVSVLVSLHSLMLMDQGGSLGEYIANGNFTALREALNLVLPMGICFNLTVYDEQMRQVNTEVITNGGFSNQDIAFVEYVCASQNQAFQCFIIHMRLAVAA